MWCEDEQRVRNTSLAYNPAGVRVARSFDEVLSDLRSERDGSSGDRIYTVTIQSKDKSGNASTRDVYVTVPKSYKGYNSK